MRKPFASYFLLWESTLHLWRKTNCLSDLLYTSGLDQFFLGSYSSQLLSISKKKISLLISSLVHPRYNYVSPKMKCMTFIFLGDNQALPSTAFFFYCRVFILAPFRTIAPGITVLRNHWFLFHVHQTSCEWLFVFATQWCQYQLHFL